MRLSLHIDHREWDLVFTLNICFAVFALRENMGYSRLVRLQQKNMTVFRL